MQPAYERPDWAFTEEISEDGTTVFRDAVGQRLTAIAFTDVELLLLQRALAALPHDEAVQRMKDKLR